RPTIAFAKLGVPKKGSVVVLAAEGGALSDAARAVDPADVLARAFAVADFKGKSGSTVDLIAPQGTPFDRLVAVGAGKPAGIDEYQWMKLGGAIAGQFRKAADISVVLDLPETKAGGAEAAAVAAGILLRAYAFDKYKTRKDDDKPADPKPARYTILTAD